MIAPILFYHDLVDYTLECLLPWSRSIFHDFVSNTTSPKLILRIVWPLQRLSSSFASEVHYYPLLISPSSHAVSVYVCSVRGILVLPLCWILVERCGKLWEDITMAHKILMYQEWVNRLSNKAQNNVCIDCGVKVLIYLLFISLHRLRILLLSQRSISNSVVLYFLSKRLPLSSCL